MKVVINDSNGKSYSIELGEDSAKHLYGKKIGDKIRGEILDLEGYEFEIRGGSDKDGFPMMKSLDGVKRKRVLLRKGFGLRKYKRKKANKGLRVRRTVRGNTIDVDIKAVNLKVIKKGKVDLGEIFKKEDKKEGS